MGICSGIHPEFPDRIGIWSVGYCGGRKTGEPGEKSSEHVWRTNNFNLNVTCDAGSGNWTRATVVGGERSHHCAIPDPQFRIQLRVQMTVLKQAFNKYENHRRSQGGSWGARDPPFVSLVVSKQLTIFRWQSDEYPLYESVWPNFWKILATPMMTNTTLMSTSVDVG